jgi:hypothetical protein
VSAGWLQCAVVTRGGWFCSYPCARGQRPFALPAELQSLHESIEASASVERRQTSTRLRHARATPPPRPAHRRLPQRALPPPHRCRRRRQEVHGRARRAAHAVAGADDVAAAGAGERARWRVRAGWCPAAPALTQLHNTRAFTILCVVGPPPAITPSLLTIAQLLCTSFNHCGWSNNAAMFRRHFWLKVYSSGASLTHDGNGMFEVRVCGFCCSCCCAAATTRERRVKGAALDCGWRRRRSSPPHRPSPPVPPLASPE